MVVIETNRLQLREASFEDAPFIIELLNSPGWLKYIGDKKVKNITDARAYIQKSLLNSYLENGFGLYVMTVKESGESIGLCGLVKRPQLGDPEIGFAILPQYEGKGLVFEAAAKCILYSREILNLASLKAITMKGNFRSQALLERLGLSPSGTLKLESSEPELLVYSTT